MIPDQAAFQLPETVNTVSHPLSSAEIVTHGLTLDLVFLTLLMGWPMG